MWDGFKEVEAGPEQVENLSCIYISAGIKLTDVMISITSRLQKKLNCHCNVVETHHSKPTTHFKHRPTVCQYRKISTLYVDNFENSTLILFL